MALSGFDGSVSYTAVITVVLLGFSGCIPVAVTTEAEPGADVSTRSTFVQAPPPEQVEEMPGYTAEVGARVQQEIARSLEAKGYRAVAGGGDLDVAFFVHGAQREQMVDAGQPDASYDVAEPYVEGTLTIVVRDAESGQSLWQGNGKTKLFSSPLGSTDVGFAAQQSAHEILERLPEHATTAP